MKQFLSQWNQKEIKKMDKADRAELLYTLLPSMTENYIANGHTKKNKTRTIMIKEMVADKKFIGALNRLLKKEGEEYSHIDRNVVIVLVDAVRYLVSGDSQEEEIMDKLYKIISKLTKNQVKELIKCGCETDLAEELATIIPDFNEPYMKNVYVEDVIFGKINNSLIRYAKNNPEYLNIRSGEFLVPLFNQLISKEEIGNFVTYTLLIPKETIAEFDSSQIATWNAITEACLILMEEQLNKQQIKSCLKAYVKQRDVVGCRYDLVSLPPEDYVRIHKFLTKLSEDK